VTVLEIVIVVILALVVLFFVGGLIAARRRARATEGHLLQKIAEADRALATAAATDRGWDRALLDAAAHEAIQLQRPDYSYETLHLIQVDDKPGTNEDRAHMAAMGPDGDVRVVLVREGDRWVADQIQNPASQ
jgi:hypothetical protein